MKKAKKNHFPIPKSRDYLLGNVGAMRVGFRLWRFLLSAGARMMSLHVEP